MDIQEIADRAVREHGAMQKPDELARLLELVAKRDRPTSKVLEIGSDRGGTLWAWRELLGPDALIVSVSLPFGWFSSNETMGNPNYQGEMDHLCQRLGVQWLGENSHYRATVEGAQLLLGGTNEPQPNPSGGEPLMKVVGGAPDLLFIDGDHTYAGALLDVARYGVLLEPGGMMALHDITPTPEQEICEVWRVWADDVLTSPHWWGREEIRFGASSWGNIGTVNRV